MARRTANRLLVEEIDEVSSVDSPAAQHSRVAIAKREDSPMPVENETAEYFDATGAPLAVDALTHGQTFYDADGVEYIAVTPEEAAELAREAEEHANGELDGDRELVDEVDERELATVGKRGPQKSLGQSLLEELSKAHTDGQRDQVFAKALDTFSKREQSLMSRAESAERIAKGLLDARENDQFVELAKSYDGVPAETTELAGILKRAAGVLDERELGTLDRILKSAGEAQLLGELGHAGMGGPSAILDQVYAIADEAIAKADISREQAVVAIFESDPAAYDQYLAEQR